MLHPWFPVSRFSEVEGFILSVLIMVSDWLPELEKVVFDASHGYEDLDSRDCQDDKADLDNVGLIHLSWTLSVDVGRGIKMKWLWTIRNFYIKVRINGFRLKVRLMLFLLDFCCFCYIMRFSFIYKLNNELIYRMIYEWLNRKSKNK